MLSQVCKKEASLSFLLGIIPWFIEEPSVSGRNRSHLWDPKAGIPNTSRFREIVNSVRGSKSHHTPNSRSDAFLFIFCFVFIFSFFSRGLYSGTNPAAKERPVSLSELGLLESSPQAIRCSVPIIVKQLWEKAVISEIPVKSIAVYWVVSPTEYMVAGSFVVLPWVFVLFPCSMGSLRFTLEVCSSCWQQQFVLARLPRGLGFHSSCRAVPSTGGWTGVEGWRPGLSGLFKLPHNWSAYPEALETRILWLFWMDSENGAGCLCTMRDALLSVHFWQIRKMPRPWALQTNSLSPPLLRANQLSIDSHWNKCCLEGQTWGPSRTFR